MFFKRLRPIIVENSCIPRLLTPFSCVEIEAITLGFVVFCRGKPSKTLLRHETIHFQQFLETLFIGFIILYFFDNLKGYFVYKKNWVKAYENIRAEQEAYNNERRYTYLARRKRWE